MPILVRAQLVADGQTNILSGVVSNLSGTVTIGTNGSFTLLIVTNGSVLSNGFIIGANSSAQSNRVIVTGSQWLPSGPTVGYHGSGNELDILNGAIVGGGSGIIGGYSTANSNLALVSGSGSIWSNLLELGGSGSFNTLVVSNGGQIFSTQTIVSGGFPSLGNRASVTGAGSLWDIATSYPGTFYLGWNGPSNQLLVADSGTFVARTLYVGYNAGGYNQLTVSNSGVVTVQYLDVGNLVGRSNSVTIDGGIVTVAWVSDVYSGNTLTFNSGLFAPSVLYIYSGSQFIFNGGTLQSVWASGAGPLVIGDGTHVAVYTMLGGSNEFFGLAISSNAVLNGSGTIFSGISVNKGGTIAPGTNNLGAIVIKGAFTLNAGSTALMKLNASSGTSDTITGMSNLVYGGTLQLTNVSGSYAAGQSFSLFAATNYSGAFAALKPAAPGPGLRWDTNELSVNGVLRVFSITSPTPVFGSVAAANGNLLISASGGIPYDPCYLLTSTNLAAPISDWSSIITNYFDSTGATTFTNGISADPAQRYFRLQVN